MSCYDVIDDLTRAASMLLVLSELKGMIESQKNKKTTENHEKLTILSIL